MSPKLLKLSQAFKVQKVKMTISQAMVQTFAELSGDYSSLHMNPDFGRKSMYRQNVVHGMLPVLFISALKYPLSKGREGVFSQINANFLKPVFVNDKLQLEVTGDSTDKNKACQAYDFTINQEHSKTVVTRGRFVISYVDSVKQQPQKSSKVKKVQLLTVPLVEQEFSLENIDKGTQNSFKFQIEDASIKLLYQILREGLNKNSRSEIQVKPLCNVNNLLAVSLASTFVGMCIPGRNATFMDFKIDFHDRLHLSRQYTFTGKVDFKSNSTSILKESMVIYDGKTDQTMGKGNISVKVNEPPIQMPSINSLKNENMDLQLKNKVVLITGASRGLGETTAKLFALHGAKVILNYLSGKKDAERIVQEIKTFGAQAIAVKANVADQLQVKKMVKEAVKAFGSIDVLVNNAIRDAYPISFNELAWEDIQKDIDVTIKGAFNCCQAVLPLMVENQGGKIINMATIYTEYPPAGQTKYVLTKSAIVGLTRSLAVEYAAKNIQVNMVVPSIVETDLSKGVPKAYLEAMKSATPMKRLAQAADVARAIIYLSSAMSNFTTGQKIMVTGGSAPFL